MLGILIPLHWAAVNWTSTDLPGPVRSRELVITQTCDCCSVQAGDQRGYPHPQAARAVEPCQSPLH